MNLVCKNCGGDLEFDIKSQEFRCSSCHTPEEIVIENKEVKEHPYSGYLQRERESNEYSELKTVYCSNCGSEIVFSGNRTAVKCPMCSSPKIDTDKQVSGVAPDGLIPFRIDKQDAQASFKKWVTHLWFAPNKLKKAYQEGNLDGIYLPFWTFDSDTIGYYRGEGGTEHYRKDSKGNRQRYVTWTPVRGTVSRFFNDIQICSSNNDAKKVVNKVLPFCTIDNTIPYSPAYLSGFGAEKYSVKANESFEEAKRIIENRLRELAHEDIIRKGYNEARVGDVQIEYNNTTYKNVLLPTWVSSFGYSGKKYLYIINGETGKVGGQRPYSIPKIVVACLAVLAVLAYIYFLDTREADAAVWDMFNNSAYTETAEMRDYNNDLYISYTDDDNN